MQGLDLSNTSLKVVRIVQDYGFSAAVWEDVFEAAEVEVRLSSVDYVVVVRAEENQIVEDIATAAG